MVSWRRCNGQNPYKGDFSGGCAVIEALPSRSGNPVKSLRRCNSDGAPNHSVEWDAKNRLRKVTRKSDSAVVAEYTYDCHSRRMRKEISNGGLDTNQTNGTTEYFYHGWQVLEERDGSGNLLKQFVYGNYIDEPWVLDDRSSSQTIGDLNDGSGSDRLFYSSSTQYSVHALTDEDGVVTEGYIYDGFGRQVVITSAGTDGNWFTTDDVFSIEGDSAVGNEYMWTGRRWNPEIENQWFRSRYYGATRGRFLSRDLMKNFLTPRQRVNLYAFAEGRSIMFTDASGGCGNPTPPPANPGNPLAGVGNEMVADWAQERFNEWMATQDLRDCGPMLIEEPDDPLEKYACGTPAGRLVCDPMYLRCMQWCNDNAPSGTLLAMCVRHCHAQKERCMTGLPYEFDSNWIRLMMGCKPAGGWGFPDLPDDQIPEGVQDMWDAMLEYRRHARWPDELP